MSVACWAKIANQALNLNDFRFGRFVQNEIEMMIDSIYGILQQSDVELRIATGEALSVSHMI